MDEGRRKYEIKMALFEGEQDLGVLRCGLKKKYQHKPAEESTGMDGRRERYSTRLLSC